MRSENPIRAAKISYIVTSVAFCVLGVLLIVLRNWSVSFIGVVTGIMLIAFGIVKLLGYFSKDLYRLAFQFDLAFGILLMTLGAIILAKPERAMSFVCLMLGVAILADGLFKLQTALDAKEFGLRFLVGHSGAGGAGGPDRRGAGPSSHGERRGHDPAGRGFHDRGGRAEPLRGPFRREGGSQSAARLPPPLAGRVDPARPKRKEGFASCVFPRRSSSTAWPF